MNNQAVLLGCVELKTIDEKVIKVKALPVRVFPELADALSDEPALVELFTGLTSDEVDALAMEDSYATFFVIWVPVDRDALHCASEFTLHTKRAFQ